jgi:imidazoleglycerol phosphate synthase cyclase subunit
MLMRRVIACLDIRDGRVVKGVRFQDLRDAGGPAELAARFEQEDADEITLLDVSATPEGRRAAIETVRRVRSVLTIPLTVGGGVRAVDDAARLLQAGADKIGINTAAVGRPALLTECAERFGSQCVVLAIDAARTGAPEPAWRVVIRSGAEPTAWDAVRWASRGAALGAGEVLLTSWDRDGTRNGYDLPLVRAISSAVPVPVIASGGAGEAAHFYQAFEAGADAVLAAGAFHDGSLTIAGVKEFLATRGVEVRP